MPDLLVIIAEKIPQLFHSLSQDFDPGKVYDPEMIGLLPVEASAVDNEDLFVPEKIQSEFLIVFDTELFPVQFLGRYRKRALGFTAVTPGMSFRAL